MKEPMNNRQYVIYWGKEDYYTRAFSEILGWSNVDYIESLPLTSSGLVRKIHKLHNSAKLNYRLSIPLKKLWFGKYLSKKYKKDDDIYFIFHASYYWLKMSDFFSYLKTEYPCAKLVFVLMDTVDSYKRYFKNRFVTGFDMNYIKSVFDSVITYNRIDASNYDLIYYPSIYSSDLQNNKSFEINCDVFFVGRAKDRLEELHHAFEALSSKGLKCLFYISDVDDSDQRFKGKIRYNQFLTYQEVLSFVKASNGLLEVVQKGSDGFTFRLDEALVYDKNIITDNAIIDDFPFKDSTKIFRLENIDQINKASFHKAANESFGYDDRYAPSCFLNFLDTILV